MAARLERLLDQFLLAASLALLIFKFALASRINVNWDEFLFLSNVYSLERGELTLVLQGSYAHLFTWLVDLPADEIAQVVTARLLMLMLLGVSAALIWRLGGRWLSGTARSVPVLVFLSAWPVMQHGGSFRADSLLLPLVLVALVLLTLPSRRAVGDLAAGAILGGAFALTIKTVLFLPLVAVLLLVRDRRPYAPTAGRGPATAAAAGRVGLAASLVASLLIGAHWLAIPAGDVDSIAGFGAQAAHKSLISLPWFPRADYLQRFFRLQPLPWLLIALGLPVALLRRRYDVAALALALLPVAFYRNAFPYFYVVMLAPASILAGFALQELRTVVVERAGSNAAHVLAAITCMGLLYQGLSGLGRLHQDGVYSQRQLVAVVHEIFPEAVNYVDRCGMIASFRRVNFFISTWGVENYRERNLPFMPDVIRHSRPAFVLVNSWALDPDRRVDNGLLPEDYDLIARFYPPYWGPLRVAGAQAELQGSQEARLAAPFPGEYRLAGGVSVVVDGQVRQSGDVIAVPTGGVSVRLQDPPGEGSVTVSLFLAAARPPPDWTLSDAPLFTGL